MCQVTSSTLRCGCQRATSPVVACADACGNITVIHTVRDEACDVHFIPAPRVGESSRARIGDLIDSDRYLYVSDLAKLQAADRRHPRFLFRGFNTRRQTTIRNLNTAAGIFPWRFPPGHPIDPVSDFTFQDLHELANSHVNVIVDPTEEGYTGPTPFTSWAADFSTALWFALGDYSEDGDWKMTTGESFICMLDLHAWRPIEDRGRHVFHAPDMGHRALPMEYLVWGPVMGRALRVVDVNRIREALNCPRFPFCPDPPRREHAVLAAEVVDAQRVGRLFQQPGDDDADVDRTLVVAAHMLARTQLDVPSPAPLTDGEIMDADRWPDEPADMWDAASFGVIRDVLLPGAALPPLSDTPLANVLMDTTAAPQLRLVRNLLLPLRAAWSRRLAAADGAAPVARLAWEDAVGAAATWTPRHVCPVPRQCEVCGRAEGETGVVLTPCQRCGKTLYCSWNCTEGDRAMHRLMGCRTTATDRAAL